MALRFLSSENIDGNISAGEGTFVRGSSGFAIRLDSANSSTDNDLRFAKGGVDYGAIQTGGGSNDLEFYVHNGSSWIESFRVQRSTGNVGIGLSPASSVVLDVKEPDSSNDLILGLTAGTGSRAQIRSVVQTSTESALSFHTTLSSSTQERFRILNTGAFSLGNSGTNYGTAGQVLTSNGNSAPYWSTPTSGTITGSGGANYVAKFTGTTAIGNSSIYDTGSYTSIGGTDTSGRLTVHSTGDVEYLTLNTTSTTNKRVRLQFTQNDNAGIEIATDYSVNNSKNMYIYDRDFGGHAWLFMSQTNNWFQGNLGVGMTSNPSARLDVRSSGSWGTYGRGNSGDINAQNTNGASTEGGWISISGYMGNSTNYYQMGAITAKKSTTAGDGNYGGDLSFWTTAGSGQTGEANSGMYQRMTINRFGRIGIGTDSPTEMIHINNTQSTASFIRFQNTGGSGVYIGGRSEVMEMYTNGTEKARIDSDGNFSVGTQSALATATNRGNITINGTSQSILAFGINNSLQGYFYFDGSQLLINSGTTHINFEVNGNTTVEFQDNANKLSIGTTNHNWFPYTDGTNYYSSDTHVFRNASHSNEFIHMYQDSVYPFRWRRSSSNIQGKLYSDSAGTGIAATDLNQAGMYMVPNTSIDWRVNGGVKMILNSAGRLVMSDSEGIQLSAKNSNLYATDGALSYYATNNAVYLNGAGPNGWLRLQASGNYNDYNTINIHGQNSSSGQIDFRTGNTERMRISSAGRVGIGTTNPSARLQVDFDGDNGSAGLVEYGIVHSSSVNGQATIGSWNTGDGYANLNLASSNGTYFWHLSKRPSASSHRLEYFFYESGFNSRFIFTKLGDFHADGDIVAYSTTASDEKLKDNIEPIHNALDKVSKLNGVSFTWNCGSRKDEKDLGVIAQNVEKVLPELVREKESPYHDDQTIKTVDYEKLTAVLIEAVKELQQKVEKLENKNCACKG